VRDLRFDEDNLHIKKRNLILEFLKIKKANQSVRLFLRKLKYDEEDQPLVSECDIDAASLFIEVNITVSESKESVIFSHANVSAGMPLGATLSDENVSGDDFFSAKFLHAKALTI
jgi:hypothetical protein